MSFLNANINYALLDQYPESAARDITVQIWRITAAADDGVYLRGFDTETGLPVVTFMSSELCVRGEYNKLEKGDNLSFYGRPGLTNLMGNIDRDPDTTTTHYVSFYYSPAGKKISLSPDGDLPEDRQPKLDIDCRPDPAPYSLVVDRIYNEPDSYFSILYGKVCANGKEFRTYLLLDSETLIGIAPVEIGTVVSFGHTFPVSYSQNYYLQKCHPYFKSIGRIIESEIPNTTDPATVVYALRVSANGRSVWNKLLPNTQNAIKAAGLYMGVNWWHHAPVIEEARRLRLKTSRDQNKGLGFGYYPPRMSQVPRAHLPPSSATRPQLNSAEDIKRILEEASPAEAFQAVAAIDVVACYPRLEGAREQALLALAKKGEVKNVLDVFLREASLALQRDVKVEEKLARFPQLVLACPEIRNSIVAGLEKIEARTVSEGRSYLAPKVRAAISGLHQ